MIHIRVVKSELYERIKNGTIDILTEIPSFDGKRRQIKVGDKISLINQLTHKRLVADCLEITYSPVEEICDIKISKPKTEVLFPALVETDEIKGVLIIAVVDNTKIILSRNKDKMSWDIPGGYIKDGETAREAAMRELCEKTGIKDTDEMYRFVDFSVGDINSNGIFGEIFVAHIKSIPEILFSGIERAETLIYDFAPENNWKNFDKSIVLTNKERDTILLSVIARMLHYYDLEYRGEDIDDIEECSDFNRGILSYTPDILLDYSAIDTNSMAHIILNADANMIDVIDKIEYNEYNYKAIKSLRSEYDLFELEAWIKNFNQERFGYEASFFLEYMISPRCENEEFVLRLMNERKILFEKEVASYFELFEYINSSEVKEKLSVLLPNGYKNANWWISKFEGDNIIADWKLTIEGNLISDWIVSKGVAYYSEYDIGEMLMTDKKDAYLIYLGQYYEQKQFIKVKYDGDNVEIDMEYIADPEWLMHNNEGPELICKVSDAIRNNPHQYYRWLSYWRDCSNIGIEEKSKNMLHIIEQAIK